MNSRIFLISTLTLGLVACALPPTPREGAPVVDRSVRPTPGLPPATAPQVEVQPLPRYRPIEPQPSNTPDFDSGIPMVNPNSPPVDATTEPQTPSSVAERPTAPRATDPASQGNQAVVALLDSAANYVADREWDKAGAALERALRIEPSNAGIWHDLAQIRLQQRDYEQAASLAAKSNTLAGDNTFVQVRNWRLIAVARRAIGDEAGADAAEAQALALER